MKLPNFLEFVCDHHPSHQVLVQSLSKKKPTKILIPVNFTYREDEFISEKQFKKAEGKSF